MEFAFFEPVLVYAAKGWALIVGARLKLMGVLERPEHLFQFDDTRTRSHFASFLCVW